MIALWATLSLASVQVSETPIHGEEVVLTVRNEREEPVQGVTVRVIHRAGLAEATEMAIGISDARGQVPWIPAQAGTAEIVAGDEVLAIEIAWTDTPTGPLSSLALLFFAALGSLGYAVRPQNASS